MQPSGSHNLAPSRRLCHNDPNSTWRGSFVWSRRAFRTTSPSGQRSPGVRGVRGNSHRTGCQGSGPPEGRESGENGRERTGQAHFGKKGDNARFSATIKLATTSGITTQRPDERRADRLERAHKGLELLDFAEVRDGANDSASNQPDEDRSLSRVAKQPPPPRERPIVAALIRKTAGRACAGRKVVES